MYIYLHQGDLEDVSSESEMEEPAAPVASPPPPLKAKKRKRSKKIKAMMEKVSSSSSFLSESDEDPTPKKKTKKRWVSHGTVSVLSPGLFCRAHRPPFMQLATSLMSYNI